MKDEARGVGGPWVGPAQVCWAIITEPSLHNVNHELLTKLTDSLEGGQNQL